jgi:hypothetical protein
VYSNIELLSGEGDKIQVTNYEEMVNKEEKNDEEEGK